MKGFDQNLKTLPVESDHELLFAMMNKSVAKNTGILLKTFIYLFFCCHSEALDENVTKHAQTNEHERSWNTPYGHYEEVEWERLYGQPSGKQRVVKIREQSRMGFFAVNDTLSN